MMKNQNYLENLFLIISNNLNCSIKDVIPFRKILQQNWYSDPEDLKELQQEDFIKLKIPLKVARSIRKQLHPEHKEKPKLNEGQAQGEPEAGKKKKKKKKNKHQDIKQKYAREIISLFKSFQVQTYTQEFQQIIETISKIVSNISKNPHENKYKILKKSNKKIEKTIVQYEQAKNILAILGFVEKEETFELVQSYNVEALNYLERVLELDVQMIKKVRAVQARTNFNSSIETIDLSGKMQEYYHEKNEKQKRQIELLEAMKQKRMQVLSKPLQNRTVRVCSRVEQTISYHPKQYSLKNEVEAFKCPQLVNLVQKFSQDFNQQQALPQNKLMDLYLVYLEKIPLRVLIKIRIEEETVEAYFSLMEKLSDLYQFISKIIKKQFYLYTLPPKKILEENDLKKSFYESESVPVGIFYVGSGPSSPQKKIKNKQQVDLL